jgi:hypothetical protein
VLDLAQRPRPVRDILATASRDAATPGNDVLRALDILLAAKLLARH